MNNRVVSYFLCIRICHLLTNIAAEWERKVSLIKSLNVSFISLSAGVLLPRRSLSSHGLTLHMYSWEMRAEQHPLCLHLPCPVYSITHQYNRCVFFLSSHVCLIWSENLLMLCAQLMWKQFQTAHLKKKKKNGVPFSLKHASQKV